MSLEETKQLIRAHRISPNKLLGQNFMVEPSLYPKLFAYASLSPSDVVLDAGAGFGFLSRFLSDKCKGVVAVEKDYELAKVLREQTKSYGNIVVVEGDVLKADLPPFNKVVAVPPYYLSSQLVLWLFKRRVDCAVMILQKEFAMRLVAKIGSEDYGWLTVVAYQNAEVELLDDVPKTMFYPQPEVDSITLKLTPRVTKPFEVKNQDGFIRLVKWLFTQRNKKLSKALTPYIKSIFKLDKADTEKLISTLPFRDKRVRELSPETFGVISNALPN